mgnify:CR=1 FL=1
MQKKKKNSNDLALLTPEAWSKPIYFNLHSQQIYSQADFTCGQCRFCIWLHLGGHLKQGSFVGTGTKKIQRKYVLKNV